MDYEYWTKTINEEDRKINNANRRFRYHCYSLESMSEELIYQERSEYYVAAEPPVRCGVSHLSGLTEPLI